VAVGAVLVIVVAIVISKRRSHGRDEDTPAATEVTGAVSPAVEGATQAPAATETEAGAAVPADQADRATAAKQTE
jgi:hypothetical protein